MKIRNTSGTVAVFSPEEVEDMLLTGLLDRLMEAGHEPPNDDSDIKICIDSLGGVTFSWNQSTTEIT